jgi:hypothetical protein
MTTHMMNREGIELSKFDSSQVVHIHTHTHQQTNKQIIL